MSGIAFDVYDELVCNGGGEYQIDETLFDRGAEDPHEDEVAVEAQQHVIDLAEQAAWLAEADLPVEETPVLTHKEANRLLGAVQGVRQQRARILEQAQEECDRINRRALEFTEAYDRQEAFLVSRFTPALTDFTREQIEGKKERSVKLLFGSLGFRKRPDTLEVTDEAAAVVWAREHVPDAVKVTTSLLKTPVKEYVQGTGEVPPGCEYHKGEDEFYIK
jgi:hypothetical protein